MGMVEKIELDLESILGAKKVENSPKRKITSTSKRFPKIVDVGKRLPTVVDISKQQSTEEKEEK